MRLQKVQEAAAEAEGYVGDRRDGQKHGQGTVTFASGNKYTGDWKEDMRNGLGTNTWANGSSNTGYWINDNFVPGICEEMGLTKGSDAFGNCVLKLMDD